LMMISKSKPRLFRKHVTSFRKKLKLHTLRERCQLNAPFLIKIYVGPLFCLSLLETVGLRVPAWYIRDFALLNFCS
jgi:hypothetical protein